MKFSTSFHPSKSKIIWQIQIPFYFILIKYWYFHIIDFNLGCQHRTVKLFILINKTKIKKKYLNTNNFIRESRNFGTENTHTPGVMISNNEIIFELYTELEI